MMLIGISFRQIIHRPVLLFYKQTGLPFYQSPPPLTGLCFYPQSAELHTRDQDDDFPTCTLCIGEEQCCCHYYPVYQDDFAEKFENAFMYAFMYVCVCTQLTGLMQFACQFALHPLASFTSNLFSPLFFYKQIDLCLMA